MATRNLRAWFLVHKWTSLLCTLFLLVICVTGLPLVFHEEIGAWVDDSRPYAQVASDTPPVPLDRLLAVARRHYPHDVVTSVFVDDDEPQVVVGLAPSWERYNSRPATGHTMKFDAHTGAVLRDSSAPAAMGAGFLTVLLHLHGTLLAGLGGTLFLALMGMVFVLAVVSGVVLYGPFMRRLRFGTVRNGRAARLRWLDLHNLLGIVLTVWMGMIGLTGVMNEFSTPLFALWQASDVQAMLRPWQGQAAVAPAELTSLDTAFRAAQAAVPGRRVISTIFPGSRFGTPYHYAMWAKGTTPLTSRLFTPILVDARTGAVAVVVRMPWYLRAVELSRPLHFGDYGAAPLKVIWALLDLGTIGVLVSGLVLWFGRRRLSLEARLRGTGYNRDVAGDDALPAPPRTAR
ncbi:MAG: PepSY-associated TM helix domain-containing protein [Gluconacetobacter liquefaciens]